jgi:hypothetical protein
MMSFLTCITGFFMNFELLPILTDYAQQWTIKISSPPFFYFELGGHLGWKSGSTDIFGRGPSKNHFSKV